MINTLKLTHFRNHSNFQFDFKPNLPTLIIGNNAAGKTNLLEALYLLSTGNSFKASKLEEMVTINQEVAHIEADFPLPPSSVLPIQKPSSTHIQITLTRGLVQGRRVQKRLFKINGVGRRKIDLVGIFPTVIFRPEDMDLLTGDPKHRRSFLNQIISQVDRDYAQSLGSYDQALKRRNKLLDLIRDGKAYATSLTFWDNLLVKHGNQLTFKRETFLNQINQIPPLIDPLRLNYQPSPISPERLASHYQADLALGYTLIGPHKDDFQVFNLDRDLSIYGSRGEQRMAILWLKKSQLNLIDQATNQRPTLLLDDIFSELDQKHIDIVFELINQQQTIVTTTDDKIITKLPHADIYRLS